ncbi:MAG: alcohol dehydrogenase catalytic domain-containing protein [Desulfatiglandales bacterium]
METKAAVIYEKSGKFILEQVNLSEPLDNEVLVRIVGSGICHTDLAGRDQHIPVPLPSVFGHEGAGVVEKVGERVSKVKAGDHVALSWMCCGACPSCRSGNAPYCVNFLPLNFSDATHTVNAAETEPVGAIKEMTGGGPDFSLECVGNPAVLRQCVDVLPLRGICGLLGVVAPGTEVVLDMDQIMNGRTDKGIIEGDAIPDLFIPRLIELYKKGRFPFDRMITFYPFDEINRAVEDMEKGRVIKPVLRP